MGQNYAVASSDGIWADVFDSVKQAGQRAGRPKSSGIVCTNSYAELAGHIDPSCLPKYMQGTGELFDLYGLCNRWAGNAT